MLVHNDKIKNISGHTCLSAFQHSGLALCVPDTFYMPVSRPIIDRFMEKVMPEPNTGCWIWMNFCNPKGYGMFHVISGKSMRLSHCVSHELFKGEIPKGLLVCHHCDNPFCVNPEHLFLGTNLDNIKDKVRKGRQLNKNLKLSNQDAIEMVTRFKNGENATDLAEEYGIYRATVYSIAYGKSRKNLQIVLSDRRKHFKRIKSRLNRVRQ